LLTFPEPPRAIINYGLEFLHNKEYTALATPQLMLKEQMAKTAQLSQFDEELYKVTGDQADKYLIAVREKSNPIVSSVFLTCVRPPSNLSALSTATSGSSPRTFRSNMLVTQRASARKPVL